MRRFGLLALVLAALFFLASCGAGSSGATTLSTPSVPPISVEYLDGAGDVALDSSFQATFSQAVDTDTVTTSTFFIVATASANIAVPIKATTYDPTVCNSANALAATVTCTTSTTCTLDLTGDLAGGTVYTACLLPGAGSAGSGSGIFYEDGTAYGGTTATFTTSAASGATLNVFDLRRAVSINAATAGITGIFPNTLRMVFSEAMDAGTLTTANVLFACQGATPTFSVARVLRADDPTVQSDRTFDVTVTDAYLYQLLDCTLDVTTNVKTSAGLSVTATNYAFRNACAVSDTFATDTSECWTVKSGQAYTWDNWPDLLANVLTFDGSNLLYNTEDEASASVARIYKNVTFLSSGFQLTLNVDDPVNLISSANDFIALDVRNNDAGDIVAYVGIGGQDLAQPYVDIYFANANTGDEVQAMSVSGLDSPASYSITLTVDQTSGMTASYSRNGVSLPLAFVRGSAWPNAANINNAVLQYAGDTWTENLRFFGGVDRQATIKSALTSGFNSFNSTQY